MEVLGVEPGDEGKSTLVELRLPPHEAEILMRLLAEGKLASLGIVDATIVSNDKAETAQEKWAKAALKRSNRSRNDDSGQNLP